LKKNNIKARVYEYLTESYAQTRIAKLLGVTRPRIHVITKELLENGYIRCINPKGNPKLYSATDKPYLLKNSSRRGCNNYHFNECRVHNCSYEFQVVVPPVRPVKWDSESKLRNGVSQHSLVHPFESIDGVTFKRIVGKNKDTLIVWLPDEIWMTNEQLPDYEKIIYSYCQQCANWFMKRYHCKLEPIGLHQKPHFAILETFEAKTLSKFGNFSVGGHVWVDCSTDAPEWETDVIDYAIIRMDMPEIIYKVMGENMELKKENKKLRRKLDC